jgi:hypothetical protein
MISATKMNSFFFHSFTFEDSLKTYIKSFGLQHFLSVFKFFIEPIKMIFVLQYLMKIESNFNFSEPAYTHQICFKFTKEIFLLQITKTFASKFTRSN